MVEESTQDTSKGTGSESVYSDMEGDTTNTQQTAATETSLPTEIPALSVGIPCSALPTSTTDCE